jgi:hypothetical protein
VNRKVIRFGLSESGINKAIHQLETYKRTFSQNATTFAERIGEYLRDEIQTGFNGAIVDDLVSESPRQAQVQVSTSRRGDTVVVVADGEDAIWVEFGAGVYHNGSKGTSPHPKGNELGFTIGTYGYGYGARKVWGYYDEGELKLTKGTPATMPMMKAVINLSENITQIAREVFG